MDDKTREALKMIAFAASEPKGFKALSEDGTWNRTDVAQMAMALQVVREVAAEALSA